MALAAFACAMPPASAGAQEVVQALPSAESQELGRALERLSRNPNSVDALVAAGNAALAVGDADAAVGFFGRAEERAPQNIEVMLGLASVAVRAGDPLRAIGLFDAAAAAGANMRQVQADRGLAHDLVGDPQRAQALYRGALGDDPKGDARRRLALSLAISGDRAGFELALAPLLAENDRASVRTRAFGLAILGQADDAVGITRSAMPAPLAARLEPYLRYMEQLTPAQQAAAGNLGKFPQTAQIGKDPAQLASYRARRTASQDAGARLEPRGTPLGPASAPPAQAATTTSAPATQPRTRSERRRVARAERQRASDPMQRSRARPVEVRRVQRANPVPAPAPATAPEPTVPAATPAPEPVRAQAELAPVPAPAETLRRAPEAIARIEVPPSQPVASAQTPPESFDLATLAQTPAATAAQPARPAPQPEPAPSVAEAFGAFAITRNRTTSAKENAVDVTQIAPVRESAAPDKTPAPQANPARHWAQVATGRDRAALRYDYRRFRRLAPDVLGDLDPHIAEWNDTNRLLAGPFATSAAADKALSALKEKGVDGFRFTSATGQEIEPLD